MSRATWADNLGTCLRSQRHRLGVGALPEPNPLRWTFLLHCSIVIFAIWGVIYTLAHVERAHYCGELAACIAHGPEDEAVAALRQMARLPDPPLETFVVAAASPTRVVARQAQDTVDELLREWRCQLKSDHGACRIAARLERLAAALDAQRESVSPLDYSWLGMTAETILRLSESAPSIDAIDLAVHCDSLLTTAEGNHIDIDLDVVPVVSATISGAPDARFSRPSRLALKSMVPEEEATEIRLEEPPAPPPDVASLVPDF